MDIEKAQGSVSTQQEGAWLNYIEGDWAFKLAYGGTGSKAGDVYDRLISKARQRNRNVLWLPGDVTLPILQQWLADYIFKGWRNVTTGGKPLDFTKENLAALLATESIGARVIEWANIECRLIENFGGSSEQEGSAASAELKSGSPVGA